MAEQLFLEGQLPDFSLLQRLLCLEPEPCAAPPQLGSPGAAAAAAAASGAAEPPPGPPAPAGLGLTFLQESARLLEPPEPPPEGPPGPAEPPPAGTSGPSSTPGPSGIAGPDALSLISLQCRHLAGGPGRRRPRKQAAPRRGAEPRDPAFRGVTLRLCLRLCPRSPDGYRLLVTARDGSEAGWKRSQEGSTGVAFTGELGVASSSEEDSPLTRRSRRCASCKTRRTPLWRIAEAGTRLCNACGIRYKKYRLRCRRCWNIPRRSGKPCSRCSNCGEALQPPGALPRSGRR